MVSAEKMLKSVKPKLNVIVDEITIFIVNSVLIMLACCVYYSLLSRVLIFLNEFGNLKQLSPLSYIV